MTVRYEIRRQPNTAPLTIGPWRVDEWEVWRDFDGREREIWISSRYYTTEVAVKEAIYPFQPYPRGEGEK